jgi:hypothetical protein
MGECFPVSISHAKAGHLICISEMRQYKNGAPKNIVALGASALGNNVFSGCHFDRSPDMKDPIFYIVPKNPHHAQQGN